MNRWILTALDFVIGAADDEENMFGRSPFFQWLGHGGPSNKTAAAAAQSQSLRLLNATLPNLRRELDQTKYK